MEYIPQCHSIIYPTLVAKINVSTSRSVKLRCVYTMYVACIVFLKLISWWKKQIIWFTINRHWRGISNWRVLTLCKQTYAFSLGQTGLFFPEMLTKIFCNFVNVPLILIKRFLHWPVHVWWWEKLPTWRRTNSVGGI